MTQSSMLHRQLTLALAAVTLVACAPGGDGARPVGEATVLTIATAADADALLPPLVTTTQGKQVVDLLFDHLAEAREPITTIGDGGFGPQLAQRWTWAPDSLSIAFVLDPRARWHDGTPVRAADVAFSYALYTDPAVGSIHAGGLAGIDSVTVRDSLTAVVWWAHRHPEQFFQVAYNLAILPRHLLAAVPRDSLLASPFASRPVGSGRYRFVQWNRQRDLLLEADSANYRGAPSAGRVVWVVAPDPTAAWLRVLSGEADVLETLRGDAYTEARRSSTVRAVEYPSLDYAYLLFNQRRTIAGTPRLFADRALRLALSQAVDRAAVVANALDSLGYVARGPFTRETEGVDATIEPPAFDSAAGARALDALGWVRDPATGVRQRGGRPLRIGLLLPGSSGTRRRVAVVLQAQFQAVGVQVDVDVADAKAYGARLAAGDFDAALNVWRTDPSPSSIRQVWGSVQGDDAGANYGRYSNVAFDAALDSATTTFDPAVRRRWFTQAYQTIVDDAAAIWLYEPRNFAAISTRVTPKGMRADAWWAALSEWQVASATR